MIITVNRIEEINAVRSWLESNLGPGHEIKTWKSRINDEIVYQAKDGFSWTMRFKYFHNMNIEINGLNSEMEFLLKLVVNPA